MCVWLCARCAYVYLRVCMRASLLQLLDSAFDSMPDNDGMATLKRNILKRDLCRPLVKQLKHVTGGNLTIKHGRLPFSSTCCSLLVTPSISGGNMTPTITTLSSGHCSPTA